eukprot:6501540-Prymnesium_polylepis.1
MLRAIFGGGAQLRVTPGQGEAFQLLSIPHSEEGCAPTAGASGGCGDYPTTAAASAAGVASSVHAAEDGGEGGQGEVGLGEGACAGESPPDPAAAAEAAAVAQ